MKFFSAFVLIILLLVYVPLTAQEDSIRVALEDIVITENRMDLPFSQVSRSMQILTRDQIQHMPAISVVEILGYVPGLDVRQRGIHGVQADLSIRGGSFDQSLVLINGIRLNDPQTGHHMMNIPLDISQIERIEVLKGPGSRIYGQNAFSGAINIITRKPDRPSFQLQLQGGSHQLGGIRASAVLPGKSIVHQLSVSRDFAKGYRYNTDYDITQLYYQGNLDTRQGSWQFVAGHSDRRFGANGFYASPSHTNQFEVVQTSLVALEYKTRLSSWQLTPRIYWRRNQDEYIFVRHNPSLYRNLHLGNSAGAEIHARQLNIWGMTGLGAEISQVYLSSNNLGNHQRTVLSAFAEHRFSFLNHRIDLTPGVSVNHFSDFGVRVFPGMDAGFSLTSAWKLFANTGYTYRVPTFTDLFYEDPANAGNSALKPESAFSWETGLRYIQGGIHFQTAWFSRMGRDLIDWTREADTLRWEPQNVQQLNMQGVEGSLSYSFPKGILQRIHLGYTFLDATINQEESVLSRYALNHLRHQVMAGIDLRGGPLSLNIQGRYQERINLEDYFLLDGRLLYKTIFGQAFLECTNLTAAEYTGPNLVPMPKRWIRIGVLYRME